MIKFIKASAFLVVICLAVYGAVTAHAQDEPSQAEDSQSDVQQEEAAGEIPAAETEINPVQLRSLVFTYWEHNAISDAKRSRGTNVRAPTASELQNAGEEEALKPPPEEREITLGGIVYVSKGDWTIWLNGKRVTPTALPKEALYISVHKEYVELKWFDDWTNQIFPVRLRPHQRFNIDTRIFLPG